MHWYHYLSSFFAGIFLGNFVPHFIKGVAGDPFPTPFSDPPGKGLSSPLVNVFWGLFNLFVGYLLYQIGKISSGDELSVFVCFAGLAFISIMGARNFSHKHKS